MAGLLAREFSGAVRGKLLSPPPLNTPMFIQKLGAQLSLMHGDTIVAEAEQGTLTSRSLSCPDPALILSQREFFPTHQQHPLPSCFVCGPARSSDDGLNIFPVPFDDHGVGSLWRPHKSVQDDAGRIPTEILWAALDCPGYFAHQKTNTLMLLGSMTACVFSKPQADQMFTVCGWQTQQVGRKYYSTTAIFDENRLLCAQSEQIWITLK